MRNLSIVVITVVLLFPPSAAPQTVVGVPSGIDVLLPYGDVDGDGLSEIVHVLFLPVANGVAQVVRLLGGQVLYQTTEFGGIIAAGDVNGDGLDDLLVTDNSNPGVVRLRDSATGTDIWTSPGSFSRFFALWTDVNGDGGDDLGGIAATTFPALPHFDVFDGMTGLLLYSFFPTIDPWVGTLVPRPLHSDVDLDGIEDFMLNDNDGISFFSPIRNLYLVSGATGSVIYAISGSQVGGLFGWTFTHLEDVDGDGINDICVGEPGIYTGSPFNVAAGYGVFWVYSGATGTLLYSFPCPPSCNLPPWQEFGVSNPRARVFEVGDQNGDGCGDMVIQDSASTAGAMWGQQLRSGRDGSLIYEVPPLGGPVAGNAVYSGFGMVIGDLDIDGRPDFVAQGTSPTGVVISYRLPGHMDFGVADTNPGGTQLRHGISGSMAPGGTLTFHANVPSMLASSYAHLLIGTSDASWGPILLPFDLSGVGSPGRRLLVAPDIITTVALQHQGPANAIATVAAQVPVSPGLMGLVLYGQWVAETSSAAVGTLHVSQGFRLMF